MPERAPAFASYGPPVEYTSVVLATTVRRSGIATDMERHNVLRNGMLDGMATMANEKKDFYCVPVSLLLNHSQLKVATLMERSGGFY